jgi:hypothetical protein
MAYLLGINDLAQVATHPLRGALFETWGITEQLKLWRNAGSSQRATFLRDKSGTEIDLVTEGLNSVLKFRNPNAAVECGCGESFAV